MTMDEYRVSSYGPNNREAGPRNWQRRKPIHDDRPWDIQAPLERETQGIQRIRRIEAARALEVWEKEESK